jgi:WD40 repeat protein
MRTMYASLRPDSHQAEGRRFKLRTLALTVCPDGWSALSAGLDFTLRLWDLEAGACTQKWQARGPISSIAVDPRGAWALLGGVRGVIWWDLESWDLRDSPGFWTHRGRVTAVAYAAPLGMVLGASEDLAIYRWELNTGSALEPLRGHRRTPSALAVDRCGHIAVSGDSAGQLRLWDLEAGVCMRAWQGHDDRISDLAISASAELAISASCDRSIRLWHLPRGGRTRTLQGHTTEVTALVVSTTGRWAVSGGDDGLRMWGLDKGRYVNRLDDSAVATLALTPDEAYVVASYRSDALSLWPTGRGRADGKISYSRPDSQANNRSILCQD